MNVVRISGNGFNRFGVVGPNNVRLVRGGSQTLPSASWGFSPEVAGLTNIVNRPFSTKAASDGDRGTGNFPNRSGGSEGWDGIEFQYPNYTIDTDATAPISPPNVLRIVYPEGQQNNAGPGIAQTLGFTSDVHSNRTDTVLYTRGAFKLGSAYSVGSVTNKFYFHRMTELGGASRGEPFLDFDDNGSGGIVLQVNFQGTPDNALGFFAANSAGNNLQRNVWYRLETFLQLNSAFGVADGIFRAWIDGVLCIERTDVQYLNSATQQYWSNIHVSPTYGGSGAPNPSEFDLFVDQLDVFGGEVVPSDVQPDMQDDFSTYTDTTNFRNDPMNLYNSVEESLVNTYANVNLDTTLGFGSLVQSMRVSFLDATSEGGSGTTGRCTNSGHSAHRAIDLPTGTTELWLELAVRFDPDFTFGGGSWGCSSAPEQKLFLFGVGGGDSRFHLECMDGQWVFGYPDNETVSVIGSPDPSAVLFDGNFHIIRFILRVGANGTGRASYSVDGTVYADLNNVTINRTSIRTASLNQTRNQGAPQNQDMHIGFWKVYVNGNDPRWTEFA